MKKFGEMGYLGCTISDYDLPGVSSAAYGKTLFISEVISLKSFFKYSLK